jgi:hypothetical protein
MPLSLREVTRPPVSRPLGESSTARTALYESVPAVLKFLQPVRLPSEYAISRPL